jgi:large subunit ribosomal protein L3
MKGILGKKIGMTQVFTTKGKLIPVTVVEVEPNVVTQIKTVEKDGYSAVQLGAVTTKPKVSNKAKIGHTNKANTEPKRFLREIRGVKTENYTLGQIIDVTLFEAGEIVDVTGVSKGKGFQGVIKRYNQTRGPMGHGSQYHRGVGSLGTRLPMHVIKGKKMPGHMGSEQTTIQNLEVVSIDPDNNVILIKGNVPGPKNSLVIIKSAVKANGKKNKAEELISYEEVVEEDLTNDEVVEESNQENETTAEEVVEVEETTQTEEVTEEK